MQYETPEAEIVHFNSIDIITASGGSTNPEDDKKNPYAIDIFG